MKKTTKIIGAVFGVLLVAALFTGAVAAANGEDSNALDIAGTYYAYVPTTEVDDAGLWYLLDTHLTPTSTTISLLPDGAKFYFSGLVEEGLYQNKNGDVTVRVEFPKYVAVAEVEVSGSAVAGSTVTKYDLEDGFVPKDLLVASNVLKYTITVTELDKPADTGLEWQLVDENEAVVFKFADLNSQIATELKDKKNGIYGLQPYFTGLVQKAPVGIEFGAPIYFTLGKSDDATIELSVEEITKGNNFIATVTGLPGVKYTIKTPTNGSDGEKKAIVSIPSQKDVTLDKFDDTTPTKKCIEAYFFMPASGVFNVTLKAEQKNDEATITLEATNDDKLSEDDSVEIVDGIITVAAEKEAYTIGDDIKLIGTNTADDTLYLYVEGVNVPFRPVVKNFTAPSTFENQFSVSGEEWDQKIKFAELQETLGKANPDAGTYTFYVADTNYEDVSDYAIGSSLKDKVTDGTYESAPVVLKQSFITLTSAPTIVAQGEKIEVKGTANAADSIIWYLFGTNYFAAGTQKVKDDEFTITVEKELTKEDVMAAGQYFLVVQHPMYDGLYSIAPADMDGMSSGEKSLTLSSILKSDKVGIYTSGATLHKTTDEGGYDDAAKSPLFSTDLRQTANAAQALCDALDSQNFDDMYAKASFIVGAPTSIVNPLPAKITQGEVITISGTTTGHKDDVVSVEFLSTAFAAVPKQAVGTAAFATITTKVQDDGTWAIEFDTSNLNCDDYTVSVAVGSLGPITAKTTIVKGNTPVEPTTVPTGQPTTAPTTAPTQTPASPGFGILAALAGLGAVAVLLLRRQ